VYSGHASVRYRTYLDFPIRHNVPMVVVDKMGANNMNQRTHCTNHILDALPTDVWKRWEGDIEEVELNRGDVLYQPGYKMNYGYFPMSAIISILSDLENGASAEVAVIGNEGLVGASIYMGDSLTSHGAVVLSAGNAFRIKSSAMISEFNRSEKVMKLLLCYTQSLIGQMGQTAACNRHHTLSQQLCRLLLMIHDRVEGDEIVMTQEALARALGVRRESVTEAAFSLQKSGLIQYARGRIVILNRPGVKNLACECYEVVQTAICTCLSSKNHMI